MKLSLSVLLGVFLLCSATASSAIERKEFCVFDVAGASGFVYKTLETYRREAMSAGVQFSMRPFTNEEEVIAAFNEGECDLIAVTDIGVRQFNDFTSAISAIGAIPRYEDLKVLMYILASPRVAHHLENDAHQVLGVIPMGAAYLFVDDREIDHVDDLRGQRVSVFEGHHDAWHMLNYVGAQPVPAKIANFSQMFNTGEVDISYAPGAAYELLEMFRGMGESGGIVRYPVGQVTTQLVARTGEFDERFVRKSRRIMSRLYPEAMRIVREFENRIPEDRWVDISPEAVRGYQEMLRGVRLDMKESSSENARLAAAAYNEDMMTILRKVRCYTNPGGQECSAEDRE
ncbi:MAG: putative solute-binding protein [Marinobacter sp.]|uniref:putative solute-binding protein n=1 Tax=Marinobacter sp. TaxID=50741 RepID=UPI00299EA4E5|nr:putative solute-binding protein [Marinobacter sp.]MDX1754804.1 putative solute-binding protein [Marinobacter sp.]